MPFQQGLIDKQLTLLSTLPIFAEKLSVLSKWHSF